ncbi:hypothetical protein PILCRDRAFT_66965 [Piloderma croceum F 1598]|uniref:Calcineurin-like phosphoesterase domain-containing protein n=1 Tax=Piloderma croceum (strain F 1598) TaxID=765440 RepID=A0A0C3G2W4_PILCF|nr:hypothetical protein PILCRDRAFT_66965 [Piloderma croceum F 1598]
MSGPAPPPPPPPPPPQAHTRSPSHFTYPLQTFQSTTDPITYVVHTSYNPASPPPLPGPSSEWTRFVCISDTHTQTFDVPDGDVLIHAGDLTGTGRKEQMAITGDWLIGMRHPVKIVIAGNHDLPLHDSWYEIPDNKRRFHGKRIENSAEVRDILTNNHAKAAGIIYLQDESYTFRVKEGGKEWSVYGSPWQPYFGNWAFNYRSGEAQALVANIPEVDILITHGPPRGILDLTIDHSRAGCPALLRHLGRMANPPRLHVFGHIHEARGALVHQWDPNPNLDPQAAVSTVDREGWKETIMVNAANQPAGAHRMSNQMRVPFGGPGFQPIIVDLLDKP